MLTASLLLIGSALTGSLHAGEFHLAATKGDIPALESILKSNPEALNAPDGNGMAALRLATYSNQIETVRFLLNRGADPDVQDDMGNTPLHWACSFGHEAITALLIDHKADLSAENASGMTPLHNAASRGRIKLAELLIAKGADVNAPEVRGWSPLDYARAAKQKEMVDWLSSHGGRSLKGTVSIADARLATEKRAAAKFKSNPALVNKIEGKGVTPLLSAVQLNRTDVSKSLIELGADINAKDKDGWSALHFAAWNGNIDIAKVLLSKGLNPDDRTKDLATPLMRPTSKEMAELLISSGADVNAQTSRGVAPLHMAVSLENLAVAEVLIKHGAGVNSPNSEGDSPLHYISAHRGTAVATLLLDNGAAINAKSKGGQTPLHKAVSNVRPELVQLLLSRGADGSIKNNSGDTPLDLATRYNHNGSYRKVIRMLKRSGK